MVRERKISRREFLTVSSLALGALALKPKPPLPDNQSVSGFEKKEDKSWTKNRFFENIEYFDGKILTRIKNDLMSFPKHFQDQLAEQGQGFKSEVWRENVSLAIQSLERLNKVKERLKEKGTLDKVAVEFLNGDFYEVGSALWTILRIDEKWKDKPSEFGNALANPYLASDEDPKDPFLEEETYSINPDWFDIWKAVGEDPLRRTPIKALLNSGKGLVDIVAKTTLSKEKPGIGRVLPPNYEKDPNLPNRPKEVTIQPPQIPEEMKKEILNILRQFNLNRSLPILEISGTDDIFGDIGQFDHSTRSVLIALGEGNLESLRKYPDAWRAFILHEFGHNLYDLISYLEDDVRIFEDRIAIEKLLQNLVPYKNLHDYFKSDGKYRSLVDPREEDTLKVDDITSRNISEVYVTEWPSNLYFWGYDANRPGVWESSDRLLQRLSKLAGLDAGKVEGVPDKTFVNRLVPDTDTQTEYKSFSDYWQKIKDGAYSHQKGVSNLERLVFDEIDRNRNLFEAKERTFSVLIKENAGQYLTGIIIPVVLANLARTRTNSLLKAIINDLPRTRKDVSENLLDRFKCNVRQSEDICKVELFAEMFQSVQRQNDLGVKCGIDPFLMKNFKGEMNRLLNDLIARGLAREESPEVKVV